MAHKCNTRQLFAIPASYENNIALAKPEGRNVHARPNPLSRQPFSSLALYHCAAKFFLLFLLIDRVLLSAWAVDALSIPRSNLLSYAFPPDSHHRESSQKGTRQKGHPHSGGPSLASPGLVSRASPSLSCSPPSAFRWALSLFFSPGQGFRTETQGCCTFTPGFCAGLAVFTRCLPLCATFGGACSPSRHTGHVLRALGRLGQMVCRSFGPTS